MAEQSGGTLGGGGNRPGPGRREKRAAEGGMWEARGESVHRKSIPSEWASGKGKGLAEEVRELPGANICFNEEKNVFFS